jgi:hypothetical protein
MTDSGIPSAGPPSASVPPPSSGASGPPRAGAEALPWTAVEPHATLSIGLRGLLASVAVVVALAVAAFVVFGSSSNGTVDPIAAAAIRSSEASGMHEVFSMQATAGSGVAMTMSGSGTIDPAAHTASMSFAMGLPNLPQIVQALGSNTLRMREIVDGSTIYMELPSALMGQLSAVGKQWISLDLSKLTNVPGISSLMNNPGTADPSEMLSYLRAVSGGVTVVGHQRIHGTPTTRYHAVIDFTQLANVVPAADRAAVQQMISAMEQGGSTPDMPVDVWVDGHGLVRRMQMAFEFPISGGQEFQMSIVVGLSRYGKQPPVEAPPSSQVASLG